MLCREILLAVTAILIYSTAVQALTELTTDCDDFSSRNYPSNYPGNLLESWKITVSVGWKVKLRFRSFNTARHGRRCNDIVEVYDGNSASASRLRSLCGSHSDTELTSTSNTMFVTFKTDRRKSSSGFYAEYDAIDGAGELNVAGSPDRCSTDPSPPPVGCGVPAVTPRSSRIVGGEEANPHSWPFMVYLYRTSYGAFSQFCGGSLLNKGWVITAAHCVNDIQASELGIRLGVHEISSSSGAVTRRVSRIIVNRDYNSRTLSDDYALIELASEVTYTNNISPVCLPTINDNRWNSLVVTIGWGVLAEGGTSPDTLHQVYVNLYNDTRCSHDYGTSYESSSMICAGIDEGGKDACQGDSGGPLVIQTDGKYKLIGITSWGDGCARAGKAGVYSKVSAVTSWINSYILLPF